MSSTDAEYALRLRRLEQRWWKRWLPNPYRWHVRRVVRGDVLEVGCGIGRCLAYLRPGQGVRVGVDPNSSAVAEARRRGLDARAPHEVLDADPPLRFDTLLCSHVLEHLTEVEATELLRTWLPSLRAGGRVVIICPQERGQASDSTHVTMMDERMLRTVCTAAGIAVQTVRSFPFPRWAGRWWVHNETVVIGKVGAT
jgi:2-polyprenyl-3-methyl-5-hydroxy-6-metoxy-1,4-benzoquinol methylase